MPLYIYKFNLLPSSYPIRPYSIVSEFGNHRNVFPLLVRNLTTPQHPMMTHPPIENGGWHFSYADPGAGERVLMKHKSWAHSTDPGAGLDGARRMDSQTADQALLVLQREFNLRIVDITPETHPEFVINNIDKFKDYIFTPLDEDNE
jgi:hypothetical protein